MKSNDTNTTRRVIIIHGWADDPSKGWIGWLVDELRSLGVDAQAPLMPTPKQPKIGEWLKFIDELAGDLSPETVLVGHSLGVYALLRYLSQYKGSGQVGKLILVGGFAGHERTQQGREALPEVDFNLVKSHALSIYNIFSDDDKSVTPEWSKQLGLDLAAENILRPGMGHFAGLHGCDTLPVVLDLIKS